MVITDVVHQGHLPGKWQSWTVNAGLSVSGAHILPDASVSSHFTWGNKFTCFCYLVFILEFSFSLSLILLYPLLSTHKGGQWIAALEQPLWRDHCTNCYGKAQEGIGKCSLFRDLHFSIRFQNLSFMTWLLSGPSNPINHLQNMCNFHQISTEGLEQKHLRVIAVFGIRGGLIPEGLDFSWVIFIKTKQYPSVLSLVNCQKLWQ